MSTTARRPFAMVHVDPGTFAPLVLSASVALALSRLIVHNVSGQVLVPLFVAIVVADIVTALALHLRVNPFIAVGVGWAVAVCISVVVVDPSLFNPSSSSFLHGSVLTGQWQTARTTMADNGTPLPALRGVVLVFTAIAAAASALTRGMWAQQRRRHSVGAGRGALLPCLAPSLAIFIYSTLVSAEKGRIAAGVSYFVGVLIFVALADRMVPAPTSARATQHPARAVSGVLVGVVVMALVVIGAGVGLSGMRLTVFHVTSHPPPRAGRLGGRIGAPPSPVTGINLVDNLLATEVTESKVVIFHAHSPQTTYWQVGTLSVFDGTEWLPTEGVTGALSGYAPSTAMGPVALPAPKAEQTFTADVDITNFISRLLPAPPGTLSVKGLTGSTKINQEGVLASKASAGGTSYTVTAALSPGLPTGGKQLAGTDPRVAPYLDLPSQPAVVDQLAHQAVGSASTPAAKAQALVNWFRNGQFRYTLSPPATTGPDPLVDFLTVTKAGFCEQFAGAYGVLARDLGIPTRLVVGFTAGQGGPGGSYTVTGADAHVWPQVYLGPDAGWVSVEPTPPAADGIPLSEGVVGVSSIPSSPNTTPTTTVASAPGQVVPATTTPQNGAGGLPTGAKKGSHHHPAPGEHHHSSPWWIVAVALAALLLVIGVAAVWVGRGRRTRSEARLEPDQRVVRSWERTLRALRHRGLSRHVHETPGEYATRVHAAMPSTVSPTEAEAVASLAALVELACYKRGPCTPGEANQAQMLAAMITANRSHRRRTRTARAEDARAG